jgi:WD repeat-containing protein 61
MPTRTICFSPDGALLYSGSDDRHISLFDTNSGQVVNSFSHAGGVLSVDASSDGRSFVAGCADHSVTFWDLGMQSHTGKHDSQHKDQVWGVRYNETGTKCVSVGEDGVVQFYKAR